jgi:hypothetical protein
VALHCALGRTRTCNPRFRKPVLYPLGYKGFGAIGGSRTHRLWSHRPLCCRYTTTAMGRAATRLRRRRDSNPQPRVARRLVSNELHYLSAMPPGTLCEWRIEESNLWPPACKAGALPFELIPQDICDRDGTRTRIVPLDKRALLPLSYTANVVVRGGIEPPASAVSERRSRPTELPDTAPRAGLEPASPP